MVDYAIDFDRISPHPIFIRLRVLVLEWLFANGTPGKLFVGRSSSWYQDSLVQQLGGKSGLLLDFFSFYDGLGRLNS